MKSYLRQILKTILGRLSLKAVNKHNAEIILVTGWTGTSVVRELIYHILEDKFNVRRNVDEVWWDLSVPLTILGYDDKRRSVFEWISLVIRATYSLLFNPKYPHKIVINLDTSSEETAKFWSEWVNPNIVVILRERPTSKVVKMISNREGSEQILFVYNPHLFKGLKKKQHREFIYSACGRDLQYKKSKALLEVTYRSEKAQIKIPPICKFIWELIPAALSVGILDGMSLDELAFNVAHFDFHPHQVKKVISKLKKFVLSDEE